LRVRSPESSQNATPRHDAPLVSAAGQNPSSNNSASGTSTAVNDAVPTTKNDVPAQCTTPCDGVESDSERDDEHETSETGAEGIEVSLSIVVTASDQSIPADLEQQGPHRAPTAVEEMQSAKESPHEDGQGTSGDAKLRNASEPPATATDDPVAINDRLNAQPLEIVPELSDGEPANQQEETTQTTEPARIANGSAGNEADLKPKPAIAETGRDDAPAEHPLLGKKADKEDFRLPAHSLAQGPPTHAGSASEQPSEATAAVAATPESAADLTVQDPQAEPNRLTASKGGARNDVLVQPLLRLRHDGGATARGRSTTEGEELHRVDAARFVGRVARAFHTAQERGGTLQLRLSPPELGAVKLDLVVKDGLLAASLETESHAARRVLLEHLPALRDRLAEQNIRVEKFDVEVRREGGGQQQAASHHQPGGQSPHETPRHPPNHQARRQQSAPVASPKLVLTDTKINLVA
jgi:flagellar hook-length control protein FliK